MTIIAFTFTSCTKDDGGNTTTDSSNNATSHYNEEYWSWDKSAPGGFLVDTLWDDDTTINF